METIDKQDLKNKYHALFYHKVQELTIKRKNLLINQNTMAFHCDVSLKTIQNFENYKSTDAFLLYAYKKILND